MTSDEIRKRFLKFFEARGHKVVASSSLIPDDPSVLLTTAGMQQFKPYYTRDADPMRDFNSLNTVSVQKSFRTSDIDEVGDDTHLTFFEMLGNFSFGGYFKKEAIQYAYDFITNDLELEISYVSVFKGSDMVPKDEDSIRLWNLLGVKDIREEGMEDVFWGPTGSAGPCGPTTEIYCKNAAGEDVEIWNIVFNEYFCSGSREELLGGPATKLLEKLEYPGVDTGMGLERLAMISQGTKNIFETDLFNPVIDYISDKIDVNSQRIIADHVRAIAFLIADGVRPSNKEAGYILRKLIRRVGTHSYMYNLLQPEDSSGLNALNLIDIATGLYKDTGQSGVGDTLNLETIKKVFHDEMDKFNHTLNMGLRELNKVEKVDGKIAFDMYQSYGLPFEVLKDFGGAKTKNLSREAFDAEFTKHQEKSRAGSEKKFGGHGLLLDTGELKARNQEELDTVTRLHSATHLLQAALRKILGDSVEQRGSDITVERTRFDLSFDRKITRDELNQVESEVNKAIENDLKVECNEMSFEEAKQRGALHFFREKYPDMVKVYSFVGKDKGIYSMELCGGPHVTHTREIGKFRIIKEEASSAGVRRIRARVEP